MYMNCKKVMRGIFKETDHAIKGNGHKYEKGNLLPQIDYLIRTNSEELQTITYLNQLLLDELKMQDQYGVRSLDDSIGLTTSISRILFLLEKAKNDPILYHFRYYEEIANQKRS